MSKVKCFIVNVFSITLFAVLGYFIMGKAIDNSIIEDYNKCINWQLQGYEIQCSLPDELKDKIK